jgi:hypothetical protein
MLTKARFTDPWAQTLRLLSVLSGDKGSCSINKASIAPGRCRKNGHLAVVGQPFDVQVHVIDRPTQSTAIVVWRDSTHCSYGDQVWQASRARKAGVCAMSGQPINQGDAIFKPRPCRPAPLNADAMILGCVINDVVV